MSDLINSILGTCADLQLIKKGGQKKVYSCIHPVHGKIVAKTGKYSRTSSLERIKREVLFLKSIESEYFPKNHDFFLDITENEFLIFEEFIKSIDFDLVKDHYNTEGRIVELIRMLIDALIIIWEKKIVHRDLKPDNILFLEDFSLKIIDLGIARFLEDDSITQDYASIGPCTPMYASPEQLQNKKSMIDMRTDFFLIGILALELYLGFHPFLPDKVGNKLSVPENIIKGFYLRPESKNATPEFSYMINNLLSKEPFRRFRDFEAFKTYIQTNWS